MVGRTDDTPPAPPPGAAEPRPPASDARIQELLLRTSRTFALAIPQLPQPTCREVSLAYLLFRIADTFEDAGVHWPRARQLATLAELGELLRQPSPEEARRRVGDWLASPRPTSHDGYLELLGEVPAVLAAVEELAPTARDIIVEHTLRTASGMAGFVARTGADGVLELADLAELEAYCYVVAGIVGEMLTELFLLGWPALQPAASFLRQRAAAFGEALQLVNILKDAADDRREGRRYLPATVERAAVFAQARRDLDVAAAYVLEVQRRGGPDGLVSFIGLPVELARATLDRVERDGPGAKLTRPEVYLIQRRLKRALARLRPAVALRS